MQTKTNAKAGGMKPNRDQAGVKVASKVKAGGLYSANHNQAGVLARGARPRI